MATSELAIVVFSLMADDQNGYRLLVLDFEQCHVTCRAKRNDDFTDKWIGIFGLAAEEREFLEDSPRIAFEPGLTGMGGLGSAEPIRTPSIVMIDEAFTGLP